MVQSNISAEIFNFGFIGWKSYNLIKKKAMEQEFSWSGLVISMSIAFFIVVSSAQVLSLVYQSISRENSGASITNQRVYRLEENNALNEESSASETIKESRIIQNTYLV